MRRDLQQRNRLILKLYLKGVARKQIALSLISMPNTSYATIRKVLNRYGVFEWHYKKRKKKRTHPPHS